MAPKTGRNAAAKPQAKGKAGAKKTREAGYAMKAEDRKAAEAKKAELLKAAAARREREQKIEEEKIEEENRAMEAYEREQEREAAALDREQEMMKPGEDKSDSEMTQEFPSMGDDSQKDKLRVDDDEANSEEWDPEAVIQPGSGGEKAIDEEEDPTGSTVSGEEKSQPNMNPNGDNTWKNNAEIEEAEALKKQQAAEQKIKDRKQAKLNKIEQHRAAVQESTYTPKCQPLTNDAFHTSRSRFKESHHKAANIGKCQRLTVSPKYRLTIKPHQIGAFAA